MRRLVLAAVATALLLPATGAWSAKTVCNLVPDKADDTGLVAPSTPVRTPAHDIRSLDVATGRKTMVVVMRLASTDYGADPAATAGMTYNVFFKIGDGDHAFFRRIGPNGQVVSDTATAGGKAIPGVTVKVDGKSITWTVPRANVPKLKGRNVVLTGFYAATASAIGLSGDSAPDGGRASGAQYVDKTASCVRPA